MSVIRSMHESLAIAYRVIAQVNSKNPERTPEEQRNVFRQAWQLAEAKTEFDLGECRVPAEERYLAVLQDPIIRDALSSRPLSSTSFEFDREALEEVLLATGDIKSPIGIDYIERRLKLDAGGFKVYVRYKDLKPRIQNTDVNGTRVLKVDWTGDPEATEEKYPNFWASFRYDFKKEQDWSKHHGVQVQVIFPEGVKDFNFKFSLLDHEDNDAARKFWTFEQIITAEPGECVTVIMPFDSFETSFEEEQHQFVRREQDVKWDLDRIIAYELNTGASRDALGFPPKGANYTVLGIDLYDQE